MLQPVVQMTRYALLYKNSMYSSMRTLSYVQCWYRKNRERTNSDHSKTRSKWFDGWIKAGAPVLGISWLVTIKDILGIEPLKLDKDPLKEKIKQSWLHRKYGRYREATQVLQIALEEAEERSEQLPITRVYDELANTYYLMGDLNEAEKYFKIVIMRLTKLHGKRDDDAEFIGVSLKLADILAMKGFLDSAEAGYKHCVKKQMHVMEEHMKKYSVAHGALVEDKHLVDTHGAFYSDPIALFGMALETYAHFLVTYRDETRLQEAEEYMDEVMKISYQIFGANSFHTINLLNNFGAVLIQKNRFELAAKYLGIGIERILYVNECASIIPGYYCNYAEALFHTGKKKEALEWARKAVALSRSENVRIQKYSQQFLQDLEKDINKDMNNKEKSAVEFLKSETKDLLTSKYGTDYNLLRWAQGYGFNLAEAALELRRHLKFRLFYDLDNVDGIEEHEVLKKYFPIGLVGETGKDNNLLVIECAGRIDLMGILKSVHLSDFLIQRYRFQEKMLSAMNSVERRTGKQAAVIYILDLEGLKFDPTLLSIVTGPYRILWASVYTNYPEWISQMFIINAPSFMTILWKAIGPLLPERTRSKIKICSANSDWKELIQKFAKAESIPKHWGGRLVDSNGDGMCRERLNIPTDPIPQELYWIPTVETPSLNDITCATIPAGKNKIITFVVPEHHPTYMVINRYCDRTFGMGIWYSEDPEAVDYPLEEMSDWCPDFDYPGMPTVDYLCIKVPGPGVFKLKFGNEQAWIRSLIIYYRVRFQNEKKEDMVFKECS